MTLINTQSYWLGAPIQVTDAPNRTPPESQQFIHSFFRLSGAAEHFPTLCVLGSKVRAGYTEVSKEAKFLLTPQSLS